MLAGAKQTLALALLLSGFAIPPGAASAQEPEAPSDPAFDVFWQRFREAVTLDDRETVRSMTRLPILLDGKSYDGQGFLARFDWLFTSAEKECFASQSPVREGDAYQLFCGEMSFVFRNDGQQYQFTDIGADD